MNNSKKWASVILTAAMTTTMIAGCSGGEKAPAAGGKESSKGAEAKVNATGFPIVNEPVNLTFLAAKAPTTANNWNETMIWQEYAKMTNIKVNFQLIGFDAFTEKRNLALTSGDYPDAIYLARMSTDDLMKYGSQGVLIKLNDLIDKHAPNFKKLMEQYPEVKKAITMADGNIYSFPNMLSPDFTSVRMGGKLWIKKEWLEALKMEEPKTTEDFYNYLKAVKSTDLNKNGKADEIPLGATKLKDLVSHFKGFFGLGTRGSSHQMVDMDPNTNGLRFVPTDERYKELLTYFNKLYSEGLIDKDILPNEKDQNKFFAKGAEGVYGAVRMTSPFTLMKQTGFIGTNALQGPKGDKLYSEYRPAVSGPGAFVITNKNKNPEATVRWMDYFFSEEGNKMFFMGFKDKSYVEKPDGNVDYTDEILKNPQGLTMEQAVVKYVTWPGGGYPGIVRQKYFKGAESMQESLDTAKKVEANLPKEIWPAFSFTEKENERYLALNNDFTTYMDEMTAKFITGAAPLSDWDKYVATIKKMGLDEYMKIYQAAYERYKK
ncbi:extracellular solute-binding protein [Paenibacillus sp. LMG 31456]|uniref:Extracellular solute-binding protein n=1 Tax=Paenibacillus foliorum TaxID=2654974 RepID=A0A972GWM7_9BACL|nr:extracellular solute-binding protein [Paenibacillus foliorum]NOU98254.1 extracellular solute-binding protein [Paenibacillus foliorum]